MISFDLPTAVRDNYGKDKKKYSSRKTFVKYPRRPSSGLESKITPVFSSAKIIQGYYSGLHEVLRGFYGRIIILF